MSENSSSSPQFPNASYAVDAYPDIPNVIAHAPPTKLSGYANDVIPPTHEFRTLVLCFDGPGDQFNGDNSNIIQFFSMLKKDDSSQQMVYYQAGIGTYTIPQIAMPFHAKLSKTIDAMVGNNLDAHLMGGYEFLMQNYEAGDRICLFGFSRGAYTARALAGMIHKVGLLPHCNYQQVPFAYRMYSKDDEESWKQSKAFKKAFSIDVDVEFVGVWDTVNSVGGIPRRLPFTRANNKLRYFRHALALDEHRVRFVPNLYDRSMAHANRSTEKEESRSNEYHQELSLQDLERHYFPQTDAYEVWFAGCHYDVGGGSVMNGTRYSLPRISLRWMIREIFKTEVGILFHYSMFKLIGMDPSTLYPHLTTRPPAIFNFPPKTDSDTFLNYRKFVSEEMEDLHDALSPMHDQLKIAPYWWILEMLPQKQHYQRGEDGMWVKDIKVNMGRGRHIPRQETLRVHRTVKIRMEADTLKEGKYWPKAMIKVEPTWVD